jgi:hypothetical protein
MKASVIPLVAVACGFSFSCFGQGVNSAPVAELKEKVSSQLGNVSKNDRVIVSYKVEEVVNTASGKRVTTYEVPKLEMVGTNDLGPNNTRTVTPVYGKSKMKTVVKDVELKSTIVADKVAVKQVGVSMDMPLNTEKSVTGNVVRSVVGNVEKSINVNTSKVVSAKASKPVSMTTSKSVSINAVKSGGVNAAKSIKATTVKSVGVNTVKSVSENTAKSVDVNVVNTYEKVLDKGYRSIDMLRKVADKSYFDGNLTAAVKYYGELLEMDATVEAVCYYRYAQSLKGLGEMEKADEMMKIFENKKNKK